jgi:hypothetical protein
MALISCFSCRSDDDIHLEGTAPDGSKILRCGECGHTWSPTTVSTAPTFTRTPYEMAKGRFATAQMVDPARLTRVERLKKQFLKRNPEPDAVVVDHWARYRELFSPVGLAACDPQDLRTFATSPIGASAGTTSVLNRGWNRLGAEEAADRIRASIEFLVRGPETTPVEDRLTNLIQDVDGTGMPGFKEPLLTKVLCVMEPDRFLTILTYGTEESGKRELAETMFGLRLPKPDPTSMQIGRLATWSNDLLLQLAGPGFEGTHHAAAFLGWAKDRVDRTALTTVR